MSPVTHFLISWSVANISKVSKKERAVITVAGIIPDIDGAGIIFDFLRSSRELHLELWTRYHHVLGHNIGFGIFLMLTAFALSTRRITVSFLVMISFHLHLICDLLGSRGPDGYQWPSSYLLPFSDIWQWQWAGQWDFNSWQNFVITGAAALHMFYIAWKNEVSPAEFISSRANTSVVNALRKRFGIPA